MPIRVECPSCQAGLSAPDTAAGKRVKCPKCQSPITVPDPNGFEVVDTPPPPRPAAARATPARPVRSPLPDDEDDTPLPRRRPRDEDAEDDRPRPRRRVVAEDDDEDDRPRRRRDEDDGDDDRPARGKGKGKKKSKLPLILGGVALAGFLLVGGVLALGYWLSSETQDLAKRGGLGPNGGQALSTGPNWVSFEGPGFAAKFPNAAPEKKDPLAEITDPEQRKMAAAVGPMDFWVREDGGRKYGVVVMQFPDTPPPGQVNQVLEGAAQGAKMATKATSELGGSTTGEWKGYPFKQVAYKMPNGQVHLVRLILAKATFYQLLVEGDAGLDPNDKTAGQFFDGFEPKPKDVPAPRGQPRKGPTQPGGRKRP